jgi:transglutaminase-like putative cysteine protease
MILEIQHETHLAYSEPVTESVTELRMEPASDTDQSCRSFHLAVRPVAERHHYHDGFGNRVHHFNLLAPHTEVVILAASIVETHPRPRDLSVCRAAWPLDIESAGLEALDYLGFRGPVRQTTRLEPLSDALRPRPGESLADLVLAVARHVHAEFEYAPHATRASSPIDDVLEKGKGVCQDFTHLMIALLRSFGVPARYVSGYIHRPGKESQSHAWCEAWLPNVGWLGIDPTNNRLVDDHFIKVAVGRDFTDVPPNKGIFRGPGKESMLVRVQTRTLETLPSLSWQEQLPPLSAPLTAILGPPASAAPDRADPHQQGQEQ